MSYKDTGLPFIFGLMLEVNEQAQDKQLHILITREQLQSELDKA